MTSIGTSFDYVMAKICMVFDHNGFFIKVIINIKVFGHDACFIAIITNVLLRSIYYDDFLTPIDKLDPSFGL